MSKQHCKVLAVSVFHCSSKKIAPATFPAPLVIFLWQIQQQLNYTCDHSRKSRTINYHLVNTEDVPLKCWNRISKSFHSAPVWFGKLAAFRGSIKMNVEVPTRSPYEQNINHRGWLWRPIPDASDATMTGICVTLILFAVSWSDCCMNAGGKTASGLSDLPQCVQAETFWDSNKTQLPTSSWRDFA